MGTRRKNKLGSDNLNMNFLKIESDELDNYYFVYEDLETKKQIFKSEESFSNYEECLKAGRNHELYSTSQIKYHDVTPR